ncbi:MAG: cation diffusion facilitator family transporter [Elusimicrobia bacterium]|nr:cation diffusion facilitator family transporter [Elusimicrobiota bacterium]
MEILDKNDSTDINGGVVSQIRKITYAGLIVNVVLFIVKLALGILGHSQAVVADAIHSLSDLITDFAIIFGVKFWSKPADDCHPYGHRRIETFITAIIGLVLVAAAVGIGYNALSTIRDAHIEQPCWIAFMGALISIVFKEVLYHWTIKVGKRLKSSAVIANAWHHRTDAFSSIPVAIAVAAATLNENWIFLDHIGAIVVSIFILSAAWKIMQPAIAELFDAGAFEHHKKEIQNIILNTSGVKSIHKLRTRRVGSGLYLDVHIQVAPAMSILDGHEISGLVKRKLLNEGPDVIDVIIHIEPYDSV